MTTIARHSQTTKLGTRAWAGHARGRLTGGERFELARQAALAQAAALPSQVRAWLGRGDAGSSALVAGRQPPDSRLAREALELARGGVGSTWWEQRAVLRRFSASNADTHRFFTLSAQAWSPIPIQCGDDDADNESAMSIRVVVADDFPLMLAAFVEALQTAPDIEVVGQATDGVEAVAIVEEMRPDVLVLDLGMPRLDGLGVLARLRHELPDTRVLVVTASEDQDSLVQAVGAGAAGYVTKRSTVSELREAVVTVHDGAVAITPSLTASLLRAFSDGAAPRRERPGLGQRELDVLRCLAEGMTDDEIGHRLFISARTVQAHLARVRAKTGLRRRALLVRWATENALL